ncbi:MAG TPA: cytochrome C oxidase subunit IV family protein [Candidatus Paceibacterota bacterium]|nr:cytochrome C oxidase subunit IV family protein [Candidatus Paceibacterota bacterium]
MNDYFSEIGFWHHETSLRTYLIGFGLSLLLTLCAYVLATRHMLSRGRLIEALLALALAQFFLQAASFLHLRGARASRDRLVVFATAIAIALILVSGSLWIMFDLNQRMMLPPGAGTMMEYMQDQSGI